MATTAPAEAAVIPAVPVPSQPSPVAPSSLYVGDLDRDVTDQQLYELFNQVRRFGCVLGVFCAVLCWVLLLRHSQQQQRHTQSVRHMYV